MGRPGAWALLLAIGLILMIAGATGALGTLIAILFVPDKVEVE